MSKPEIFQATAELLFTSANFDSVFVELRCGSGVEQALANSYIVKPGGIGILIPVARANQHSENAIRDSDEFTAELVWTDNRKGIADDSNIRLITESGSGKSGHILVLPGTAEGNAVVAVRSSVDDQIKWSWHIWVTDYEPEAHHTLNGHDFMDRNLGAIANPENPEISILGLLYQWGRKDPFPGAAALKSNTGLTVYNASGISKSVPVLGDSQPGLTATLSLSVANPTIFYKVPNLQNNYDWLSSSVNTRNDNLWGHNYFKSIYDPCPVGWRVPSFEGSVSPWRGLTNSNFSWSGNGRVYAGSFYPAAGTRSCSTGGIFSTPGGKGSYWTASPSATSAYSLDFSEDYNGINTEYSYYRGYALSVRCVKE